VLGRRLGQNLQIKFGHRAAITGQRSRAGKWNHVENHGFAVIRNRCRPKWSWRINLNDRTVEGSATKPTIFCVQYIRRLRRPARSTRGLLNSGDVGPVLNDQFNAMFALIERP